MVCHLTRFLSWENIVFVANNPQIEKQEFAAGCLRQCQLSARVDRSEVIEILASGGKSKEIRAISRLNSDKRIEWEFGNARLHIETMSE
jgi:hypothetical protein